MLEFLLSNLGTIIVGVILLAIVAVIVFKVVKDKKKGKPSCGCNCANCPSACNCHKPN